MLDCYNFLNITSPSNLIDYNNLEDYDNRGNNSPKIKYKNRIFCFKNNSFLNNIKNPHLYYFLSHFAVKFISFTSKAGIKTNMFQEKQVSEIDLNKIYNFFEEDISKLEKFTNIDLSIWKK